MTVVKCGHEHEAGARDSTSQLPAMKLGLATPCVEVMRSVLMYKTSFECYATFELNAWMSASAFLYLDIVPLQYVKHSIPESYVLKASRTYILRQLQLCH